MIDFELSAIDIILAIAVVVLLLLYLKHFSSPFLGIKENQQIEIANNENQKNQNVPKPKKEDYSNCPRGFGKIKNLSEDNSVSERCLGCYQIMECYTETD
ncbi:MAG: hypothetical protein P8X91_02305 [Candidatus Bathyarchaeota archaeon]|jgi:hypothetical protein